MPSEICGACGEPWTGEKCGQQDNGHPFLVCYPHKTEDNGGDQLATVTADRDRLAAQLASVTAEQDEARDVVIEMDREMNRLTHESVEANATIARLNGLLKEAVALIASEIDNREASGMDDDDPYVAEPIAIRAKIIAEIGGGT